MVGEPVTSRYWVVKGRPARNDLAAWLAPGAADVWQTRAAPSGWKAGDRVFFWEAAPKTQVVGLGEIVSVPTRPVRRGVVARFHVIYLTSYLEHPVHIGAARKHVALKGSVFLKSGAAGTLFRLSIEEAEALFQLVVGRNPTTGSLWPSLRRGPKREVVASDVDDLPDGASEGRRRLMIHYARERDRILRRRKIEQVTKDGEPLRCEVCEFDFESAYGALGEGYCEVHHVAPLAASSASRRTLLGDLAIVCSNCHRMMHRDGSCRTLATMRRLVLAATRRR
ncbi:MAG: HNH endonuclease [Thermoanaerobaculia bacterium]